MYIKPQYAKIALKHAVSKRKAQGIVFDPKDIASYRAKLKEIAKNNEIKEGTRLYLFIYLFITTLRGTSILCLTSWLMV